MRKDKPNKLSANLTLSKSFILASDLSISLSKINLLASTFGEALLHALANACADSEQDRKIPFLTMFYFILEKKFIHLARALSHQEEI